MHLRNIPRYLKAFLVWLCGKAPRTNCPKIKNSVFICQNGDIYCCCGGIPYATLGNINLKSLSDIWKNNLSLKIVWIKSFFGYLNCYFNCPHLFRKQKIGPPRPWPISPYPQQIHVQFGLRCNFNCSMCWQDHADGSELDIAILKQNIAWDKVEEVILQGGEIFIMPKALEFYRWLTEQKKKTVNVITNGSVMDDENARVLLSNGRWVTVSVNAASAATYQKITRRDCFDKVLENIRRLVELKRKLGLKSEVVFHFTCTSSNLEEVPDAILLAEILGCDRISYSFDQKTVPGFLQAHPQLRGALKKRLEEILSGGKLTIKFSERGFKELGILDNAEKYAA